MAITFYCGSGSPYAWRVWLSLEHKALPYELKMLSFSSGDLKTPEFGAINPRRRVPTIVDHGHAIYESAAIVEYLEDAYPESGLHLFPTEARGRARARRLILEAGEFVGHPLEAIGDQISKSPDARDAGVLAHARDGFVAEVRVFEKALEGAFLCGPLQGAADYTLYPMLALALRFEKRHPDLRIREALGEAILDWMGRIEKLRFYDRTYPPHWRT